MVAAIMRWTVRVVAVVAVIAATVMVRVVIVVIVIPDVHSVAAVFVAPFDLSLEMGPFAVLVALYCVVRVAASVAEIPCVRIRDTGIPIRARLRRDRPG